MRLKVIAGAIAAIGTVALLAAPADAAPRRERVVDARGHTIYTSRGEDGRTRTRVIIQKRSYLNPGTETFPGERSERNHASFSNGSASGILDNTAFGGNQTALPGPYDLPSKNNPWLRF
jgi:hypothetical protein